MTAEFIGSGRQDFLIQYGKTFHWDSMISNCRREPIKTPPAVISVANKTLRNPNVFKDWQKDTNELADKCFETDIEGWKVNKFVKDP
jgi:hypothetical protein